MNPTPEEVAEWKRKADQYDKLQALVDEQYEKEEGDGDLCSLGEQVAIFFGYFG